VYYTKTATDNFDEKVNDSIVLVHLSLPSQQIRRKETGTRRRHFQAKEDGSERLV